MSRTVVGLFKSYEEAQRVKNGLVNEGYDAADIQVIAKDDRAQISAAGESTTKDTGFAAAVGNFFRSFTGADPEDETHYTNAVGTGGSLLAVTVPDNRADAVAAVLERFGAQSVDERSANAPNTGKSTETVGGTGQKLNVVEEELQVGKRQVQRGGVRVYSHVTERPVQEQVTLKEEHINVTRNPVNRPATEADFHAFKEGTIELKESAEEAVVSKTARVVEEVVIGKQATERTETVKDTVRRTDVTVEKVPGPETGKIGAYSNYEPQFREHYAKNYARNGAAFETYAPAYRYGHKLASDSRYAKSDWTSAEAAARNDWAQNGVGAWEDMKGAVRHGWDKVRGASTATA